jgi:putative transposase
MIRDNNDKIAGNEYNKAILDVGWGTFIKYTESKAEEAGRSIEKVNPKNTSRMCSKCGNIVESIPLDVRVYRCVSEQCNLVIDRNVNAAMNILSLGIQTHNKKLLNNKPVSC